MFSEKEQQKQWFVGTHRREADRIAVLSHVHWCKWLHWQKWSEWDERDPTGYFQQEHTSDIYTQRKVDMLCKRTEESRSPSDTGQFQCRQDWEKEALGSQRGVSIESISGAQSSSLSVCMQAVQLTFPVLSMPLMTHRYTVVQQATRQRNSFHWIVPVLLMSDVIFRVCRYQK